MTAREAALKALEAFRRNNAWPDLTLGGMIEKHQMSAREAALATRILNGVLQNMMLCDYYASHFSSIGLKKLEPRVLDILRISIYQLVFMDRIPPSAAVNEGVALVKRHSNPRAAGFVNAVLRKTAEALRNGSLPEIIGDRQQMLSIKYSHPLWLIGEYFALVGDDSVESLLAANNAADLPLVAQVNTLKADVDEALAILEADNVAAQLHEWLDGCVELYGARNIAGLDAFKRGSIYIQDAAARLAVMAADPKPGDYVIDGCAAPGGKSFSSAIAMENKGKITAIDVNGTKLRHVEEGSARLGITIIDTVCADAAKITPAIHNALTLMGMRPMPDSSSDGVGGIDEYVGKADVVLADVPCSGFGVIRKKPEIRYKPEDDIAGLIEVQRQIISSLSACVKPGGVLLYSTCTVLPGENEGIIEWFLRENKHFSLEGFTIPGAGDVPGGMITLWPHIHKTDGFFICKLNRMRR